MLKRLRTFSQGFVVISALLGLGADQGVPVRQSAACAGPAIFFNQGGDVDTAGGSYNWDPYGYYIACTGRSERPSIQWGFSTCFNMEVRYGDNSPNPNCDYASESFDGYDWSVDNRNWGGAYEWDQNGAFGDPDAELCDADFNDFWWWDYGDSTPYIAVMSTYNLSSNSTYTAADQTWHVGEGNDEYDLNIDRVTAYWCALADRSGDHIEY